MTTKEDTPSDNNSNNTANKVKVIVDIITTNEEFSAFTTRRDKGNDCNSSFHTSQTDENCIYATTDDSLDTDYDTNEESEVNTDFEATSVGSNTSMSEISDDENAGTVYSDTYTTNASITAVPLEEENYTNKKIIFTDPIIESPRLNTNCGESYHETNLFGHKFCFPFNNNTTIEIYNCNIVEGFNINNEETSLSSQSTTEGSIVSTHCKSFVSAMKDQNETNISNVKEKSKEVQSCTTTTTTENIRKTSNKQSNSDDSTQETTVVEKEEANTSEEENSVIDKRGSCDPKCINTSFNWSTFFKDGITFSCIRMLLCQQPREEEIVGLVTQKKELLVTVPDWLAEKEFNDHPAVSTRGMKGKASQTINKIGEHEKFT